MDTDREFKRGIGNPRFGYKSRDNNGKIGSHAKGYNVIVLRGAERSAKSDRRGFWRKHGRMNSGKSRKEARGTWDHPSSSSSASCKLCTDRARRQPPVLLGPGIGDRQW